MAPPQHAIGKGDGAEPVHAPKVPAFGERVYAKHAALIVSSNRRYELRNRLAAAVVPLTKTSEIAYALLRRKYRYTSPIGAMKIANAQQISIVVNLANSITNAFTKKMLLPRMKLITPSYTNRAYG